MLNLEFSKLLPGWKEKEYPWSASERNKKEWDIQIPLLKFGKLKKLKKNYRFVWDDDWCLRHFLWEEITKKGFVVEGYIAIRDYYEEKGKTNFKHYYLTSKIGEEPVTLQSPTKGVDILHRVHNNEEHEWIIRHALEFYTEIRI